WSWNFSLFSFYMIFPSIHILYLYKCHRAFPGPHASQRALLAPPPPSISRVPISSHQIRHRDPP
uniref:Uncharacterized protein n=1 Tax=Aegilops tauschii subsp. strangulata TaxID=200361 RepID=A0A453SKF5_AEGTS